MRVARLRVEEDAGEGLCGGGRRSLAPSGSHAPHPPPNRHAPSWHARLHAVEPCAAASCPPEDVGNVLIFLPDFLHKGCSVIFLPELKLSLPVKMSLSVSASTLHLSAQ